MKHIVIKIVEIRSRFVIVRLGNRVGCIMIIIIIMIMIMIMIMITVIIVIIIIAMMMSRIVFVIDGIVVGSDTTRKQRMRWW